MVMTVMRRRREEEAEVLARARLRRGGRVATHISEPPVNTQMPP